MAAVATRHAHGAQHVCALSRLSLSQVLRRAPSKSRGGTMAGENQVDPQTVLSMMREQCTDLAAKINALDLDKTEHELVIKALEPLDQDRKCFRMVGNVVVERTVKEVLPAVLKNKAQVCKPDASRARVRVAGSCLPPPSPAPPARAAAPSPRPLPSPRPYGQCTRVRPSHVPRCAALQIKEMMDKMTENLGTKQKEADDFGAKHRIQVQGRGSSSAAAAAEPEEGGSQGVLI